jgi:hypothetical protein
VNEPAVALAVSAGAVARPLPSVVAVAWVAPPGKLALAAALAPQAPTPADPTANVTLAPPTGLPLASTTLTSTGSGKRPPTLVDLRLGAIAVTCAGTPAAVFVNENDTDPYAELAVTV